jgi:hypothetical protein
MPYEFFLSENSLPNQFRYPETYIKFISKEFPNLDPWHFFYSKLQYRYDGLKQRYPQRIVVPFARRGDNDDIACFEASEPSDDPNVIIIHDFASEGWENRGKLENFLAWVKLAKAESNEWETNRRQRIKKFKYF